MVDMHVHILPAVDDGAKDEAMTRAMMRRAADAGITFMIATPHVYHAEDQLRNRRMLRSARSIAHENDVALNMGCEFNYRALRESGTKELDGFCLSGTRCLLLEFSNDHLMPRWDAVISEIMDNGYLPIIAAGALLGPMPAMIVGALGDFIGAHLFPAGAYFPGFTLTSAIVGVLYALPLYKKQPCWIRSAIAALLGMIPNLFLNSLWLSMLYTSKGYWGWVAARSASYLVEIPVQVVLIYLCLQGLSRMKLPVSVRLPKKEKKA